MTDEHDKPDPKEGPSDLERDQVSEFRWLKWAIMAFAVMAVLWVLLQLTDYIGG